MMMNLKIDEVSNVAVLGVGTMGHGIAEVVALSGFNVKIYDIREEFINNAIERIRWSLEKLREKGIITNTSAELSLRRIRPTLVLEEAVRDAQIIIEAIPEDINLKRELFQKVDAISPKDSILASNTSTLPITELASFTSRPEQFIGLHFFNPPQLMPLVEIVMGEKTGDETLSLSIEFVKRLGKEYVVCKKDVPGFIVNRILGPLLNEAAWMVHRGEASIEQIDSATIYKVGLPMGLFELADYIGIDVIYNASKAVSERDKLNLLISPLFIQKYEEGKLGKKKGEGFYRYYEGTKPQLKREASEAIDPVEVFSVAVNAAAWLIRNGVCSIEDIDKSVKLGLGFPDGLLRMADRWGIDKIVKSLQRKSELYGQYYSPDQLLVDMEKSGKLGVSTGSGFYQYTTSESKFEEVILRKEPPIAWIILNRPQRMNAITERMIEELGSAIRLVDSDKQIRVVIIRGSGGKAFSIGADITSIDPSSPTNIANMARRWFETFSLIERSAKPFIAAIEGYALGGGCELALSCDFRIASEGSVIGLTETSLGLIPGAGGTQRLARIVGLPKAKEMIFFAEKIGSDEALKIGLVNRVFTKDNFEIGLREFAMKLAKQPPIAIRFAKYATNISTYLPADIGQLFEASSFGLLLTTKDVSEGISALLSKREPEFKGE